MGQDQPEIAEIIWHDTGVPVSTRFDDPYFSLVGGLAETRHVFLAGNGLPERFAPGFHVAELGFGTGLNLLATWADWRAAAPGGSLRYTAFEAYPMHARDMARALAAFPELAGLAAALLAAWQTGKPQVVLDDLVLDVIVGDARATLPDWQSAADAWYLDGFAPVRNPELWEPALLSEVARHTRPGGSFATYSAAGHVRRALAASGFAVKRVPGYGRKRHMTCGRREEHG